LSQGGGCHQQYGFTLDEVVNEDRHRDVQKTASPADRRHELPVELVGEIDHKEDLREH
jgi:hypothetical protein